jgi:hypothetical protein
MINTSKNRVNSYGALDGQILVASLLVMLSVNDHEPHAGKLARVVLAGS